MNGSGTDTFSAFKRAQVHHRRQGNNPNRSDDLAEVIDFSRGGDDRIVKLEIPKDLDQNVSNEDIYRGPIYGLEGFPGFLFAPNALADSIQTELAYQSVSEYCEAPHRTNIDLCPPKENEECNYSERMWELWKKSSIVQEKKSKKQKLGAQNGKKYRCFKKLSWATTGLHYNWTERSYNKEEKSEMPKFLGNLSKIFARTSLMLEGNPKNSSGYQFSPEASIVNFYNTKSLMGGHRDDLEEAIDKPVVSLSTGLSAIFLLGGKTKDDEPVLPILIRAGDVMCLGGESRLNYHSMARVLPHCIQIPERDSLLCPRIDQQVSVSKVSFLPITIEPKDRVALEEYLCNHRININIRMVWNPKSTF